LEGANLNYKIKNPGAGPMKKFHVLDNPEGLN